MIRAAEQFDRYVPAAVQQAREVLDLWEENCDLREQLIEAERYRQMYFDLLNEGIRHGERMMGNVLSLLLTPPSERAAPAGAGGGE